MLENYSKLYKHCLKTKVRMTTGTMIAILLGCFTASVVASEITVLDGGSYEQTAGDSADHFITAGNGTTITVDNGASINGSNSSITPPYYNGYTIGGGVATTILNNGIIGNSDSNGQAVLLGDKSTLTNSTTGFITASGNGVEFTGNFTLNNSGEITSSANYGISTENGYGNIIINNDLDGEILASEMDTINIGMTGTGIITVNNDGIIDATNGNAIDIDSEDNFYQVAINNTGIINGGVDAIDLYFGNGGKVDIDNNGGTLTATDDAIGIYADTGTKAVEVNILNRNNGLIQAEYTAIDVELYSGGNITITNEDDSIIRTDISGNFFADSNYDVNFTNNSSESAGIAAITSNGDIKIKNEGLIQLSYESDEPEADGNQGNFSYFEYDNRGLRTTFDNEYLNSSVMYGIFAGSDKNKVIDIWNKEGGEIEATFTGDSYASLYLNFTGDPISRYIHNGNVNVGNSLDLAGVSAEATGLAQIKITNEGDISAGFTGNSYSLAQVLGNSASDVNGTLVTDNSTSIYGIEAVSDLGKIAITNTGDVTASFDGTSYALEYIDITSGDIYDNIETRSSLTMAGISGISNRDVQIENEGNITAEFNGIILSQTMNNNVGIPTAPGYSPDVTSAAFAKIDGIYAESDFGKSEVINKKGGEITATYFEYLEKDINGDYTLPNIDLFGGLVGEGLAKSTAVQINGIHAVTNQGSVSVDNNGTITAEMISAPGVEMNYYYDNIYDDYSRAISINGIFAETNQGNINIVNREHGDINVSYHTYNENIETVNIAGIGANSYDSGNIVITNDGDITGDIKMVATSFTDHYIAGIIADSQGTSGDITINNNGNIALEIDGISGATAITASNSYGKTTINNSGNLSISAIGVNEGITGISSYSDYPQNTVTNKIVNDGDISLNIETLYEGGAYGIATNIGSGSTVITNNGNIDITSLNGSNSNEIIGINAYQGIGKVEITNTGNINLEIDGFAGATAIYGAIGNGNMTITNSGNLSIEADGVSPNSDGAGISAYSELGNVIVSNSGNITIQDFINDDGPNSTGIEVSKQGSGNVTVNNSGNIEASLGINIDGNNFVGDIALINSGTITTGASTGFEFGSTGISVSTDYQLGKITVTNSLNIEGNEDYSDGIYISAQNFGGTLNIQNSGTIAMSGDNSVGIYVEKSGFLPFGEQGCTFGVGDGCNFDNIDFDVINSGNIIMSGDHSAGMSISQDVAGLNSGLISVKGHNGVGMYAEDGALAINKGIISLDKGDSSAMMVDYYSQAVNEGTIQVNYLDKTALTENQLSQLTDQLFQGNHTVNNGIIKNASGNIIYSGGDNILNVYKDEVSYDLSQDWLDIENMDKNLTVKTDFTVHITGTTLNGILNASEVFGEKECDFLVIADNEDGSALNIDAILNAGRNGLLVDEWSEVNLSADTAINATELAVSLENGSLLNNNGGTITAFGYNATAVNLGTQAVFNNNGGTIVAIDPDDDLQTAINMGSSSIFNNVDGKIIGNIIMTDGTLFSSTNGAIQGDISWQEGGNSGITVELDKNTVLMGSITGGDEKDNVEITNSSYVSGDIDLGDDQDLLVIDASSANLIFNGLSKEPSGITVDGGLGDEDLFLLGTKNELATLTEGTIKNFQEIDIKGDVYLGANVRIETDNTMGNTYGQGNVDIEAGTKLILGLQENDNINSPERVFENAFVDIEGNTISGEGDLYVDTRTIDIGTGILVDMVDTDVALNENQLFATQFIYDVTFADNNLRDGIHDLLQINIVKDVTKMGLNSKYQDVWNSIVAAGQQNAIGDTTYYGTAADLGTLLFQAKERTAYGLAPKLFYDGFKSNERGIERFIVQPKEGTWITQAQGVGYYEKSDGNHGKFDTSGVVVGAEYGISNKGSLGVSFGGAHQKAKYSDAPSQLTSDTFYGGIYGKYANENFNLLMGAGYQSANLNAKNRFNNGIDSFENTKDYNGNGYNLFVNMMFPVTLSETLRLEPNLGATFNYISLDGVNEGAGEWKLTVEDENFNLFDITTGVDIVKDIQLSNAESQLKLSFEYKYTGGDDNKAMTGSFNGNGRSNYAIEIYPIPRNTGTVGVSYDVQMKNGFFYGAAVGYEFGDETSGAKVGLGAGYQF